MRKHLIVMVAAMCLASSSIPLARAQGLNWGAQRKSLKSQQKLERKNLKNQQKNVKKAWKSQKITSAEHTQASHQMQRERRTLKQSQKGALQDMKDRQRTVQTMNRTL